MAICFAERTANLFFANQVFAGLLFEPGMIEL
jgi:hypothetical protein